eukprot:scaffold33485_cov35-Tisochrysis_lutea.AAC.3
MRSRVVVIPPSLRCCDQGDEELFELTQLNPTLLSEMSTKTRFLFLEVYYDDLQDVYSEVMETLQGDMVRTPAPREEEHEDIQLLPRTSSDPFEQRARGDPAAARELEWLYRSTASSCAGRVHRDSTRPIPPGSQVTYDSLRKFKHLAISLSFKALSDVCQAAFDKTDFDPFPEVAPDERPGCMCKLDVAEFTKQTAAAVALTKMMVDAEGELPPAAEARIIRVEKKFYYDDI